MEQHRKAGRFGMTVIAITIISRLFAAGIPERAELLLKKWDIRSFIMPSETGQDVRSSVSIWDGFRFLPESAVPLFPKKEPERPSFREEDLESVEISGAQNPDLRTMLLAPWSWDLTSEQAAVLILHTHSTESYTKQGEDYIENAGYRTLDEAYNLISIGDRVAQRLEAGGIRVIHDRTFHDYPSYNGAYTHARKGIQAAMEEHPEICLILDLHRDAGMIGKGQLRTHAEIDGEKGAQLMFVVGTGSGGLGNRLWEENLSLVLKLQVLLEQNTPGIMRPIDLRAQRFNQDLLPGTLLVEVGAAGNTHGEALLAAEKLADAILALRFGSA